MDKIDKTWNEIMAAYDYGFSGAIDMVKKRLRKSIDVTNTLPEQQMAYKEMLTWIEKYQPTIKPKEKKNE